jgi:hypothetical protein
MKLRTNATASSISPSSSNHVNQDHDAYRPGFPLATDVDGRESDGASVR